MAPKAIKISKKTVCPVWGNEVPATKRSQFHKQLGKAQEYLEGLATLADAHQVERFHGTLFSGLTPTGTAYYAGNFRKEDPVLPCLAKDVEVGGIRGEHFTLVGARMLEWSGNGSRRHEALLDGVASEPADFLKRVSEHIALLVGEFIRIHPFLNGNGRTSRALWNHALDLLGFEANVRVHPRPEGAYGAIMAAAMAGDDRPLLKQILLSLARAPSDP